MLAHVEKAAAAFGALKPLVLPALSLLPPVPFPGACTPGVGRAGRGGEHP